MKTEWILCPVCGNKTRTMIQENTILKIGGNEETRRFLANLGFVTGTEISVVSAIGGNVIVNVKDARVAVNSDMAKHIMI